MRSGVVVLVLGLGGCKTGEVPEAHRPPERGARQESDAWVRGPGRSIARTPTLPARIRREGPGTGEVHRAHTFPPRAPGGNVVADVEGA